MSKTRSFFEKLTGGIRMDDGEQKDAEARTLTVDNGGLPSNNWMEEANGDAELTVDVYQTANEIVVQTMVAGVKPEDLSVTITRDMITIRGKREETRTVSDEDYFTRELYWGSFSRTVSLPQEVEPDMAEAIEKHGLLIVKLPKIDKTKQATVKIKSI